MHARYDSRNPPRFLRSGGRTMLSGVLLISLAMVAADSALVAAADIQAYEAERAKAGKDPDAHVRLAFWCEAHGMFAERARHLALAVLNSPSHPLARGLMGLVAYEGHWQRPEVVSDKVTADPGRA